MHSANLMGLMPVTAGRRLTYLGVPVAFHAGIVARRAPRFHTLVHLTIILASLAAAVAAIAAWSQDVSTTADEAAKAAHALLYDSDIGAESLGLILTVLFAAGWLCGLITWRRGSEYARRGWASDLMHEPAKNKAITDWLWRQMIRRHAGVAVNADDFLDQLSRGVVRDLGFATLAMLALTAVLGALQPARISFATDTTITDHPVLPLAKDAVRPVKTAAAVISGCPNLPKDGNTLVYRLGFADGSEANLGAWQPLAGNRLAALEAVAARLPTGTARKRFTNPIGSDPLAADCLRAIGGEAGATVLPDCCSYWPCRKLSERS
jgi:hypothetical protein